MKTVKMKRKEIKGIDDKGGLSHDARHYFWSSHDFSCARIYRSLKKVNVLAIAFAGATFLVFGWFTVMTIIYSGYPTAH